MQLIIMGAAGAGKGTQAKHIAEHFGIPAISTGDIFRANVSQGTPLGVEAKRHMDAGEHVPDETTNRMVRNLIDEQDAEQGFLLHGYPRTLAQVEELDEMINFTGHQLDAVLSLVVDKDEVVKRLLQRPDRGPRRRHRGRHPAPPGGLRRADRAAHRGLEEARDPGGGRRPRRDRQGHTTHPRHLAEGVNRDDPRDAVSATVAAPIP